MTHPFLQHPLVAVWRKTRRDEGQDLLEYGLLVALIALVAFGAVSTVGQTIYNVFWNAIGSAAF
jgi:Flp pilus assembly pilin Flp